MALELLAFIVLLSAVARWVLAPLRGGGGGSTAGPDRAALEAEWEARAAGVRDAELDLATGKLTVADHRALDAELRAAAATARRTFERSGDRDGP